MEDARQTVEHGQRLDQLMARMADFEGKQKRESPERDLQRDPRHRGILFVLEDIVGQVCVFAGKLENARGEIESRRRSQTDPPAPTRLSPPQENGSP